MYKNCLRVEDDSDREWETENVEHYRKRNFNWLKERLASASS